MDEGAPDASTAAAAAAPTSAPRGRLRTFAQVSLALLLVFRIGAVFANYGITPAFLNLQDRWLVLVGLAVAVLSGVAGWKLRRPLGLSATVVAAIALCACVICYLGHYALLLGYDLSRDEQMAVFDARIYAAGRLAWPLPPAWQPDAAMLNLLFMLPVTKPVAWVSGYLPGNAMLRALVGAVADPALTGPLLTGGSLLLLWSCARKLWPGEREPATVAFLLLACSAQVLLMGMTAYAMPAHLFFNLLWLRLFLANRRIADLGALAVGFVATGLHQPLFHPLFVAPWLLVLLVERRWARLALFVLGYAAIAAFWLSWPAHVHALVAGPQSLTQPGGTDYLSILLDLLRQNRGALPLMAENLLRFFCWQHVLLLPLLLAGFGVAFRDRKAAALALGFILPIVVMGAILPYQGHGFGYRYLHGLLGNAALLGGYAWRRLAPVEPRLRGWFVAATAGTVLVMLPLQAAMAHWLYVPFARASARLNASGADYAIVGAEEGPFALDLVLNRPDLSNRPIRLVAGEIDDIDALAARICRPGVQIALPQGSFYGPIWDAFHTKPTDTADRRAAEQAPVFGEAGCSVVFLR